MALAFLFHYLMLNMFRMLIHPSSGACDLFVELFHGLYCSGMMRIGVTVRFDWGGVVWYPDAGRSTSAFGYDKNVYATASTALQATDGSKVWGNYCKWWHKSRTSASACIRIPHHTTPVKQQRNTNTHFTRATQPMK